MTPEELNTAKALVDNNKRLISLVSQQITDLKAYSPFYTDPDDHVPSQHQPYFYTAFGSDPHFAETGFAEGESVGIKVPGTEAVGGANNPFTGFIRVQNDAP